MITVWLWSPIIRLQWLKSIKITVFIALWITVCDWKKWTTYCFRLPNSWVAGLLHVNMTSSSMSTMTAIENLVWYSAEEFWKFEILWELCACKSWCMLPAGVKVLRHVCQLGSRKLLGVTLANVVTLFAHVNRHRVRLRNWTPRTMNGSQHTISGCSLSAAKENSKLRIFKIKALPYSTHKMFELFKSEWYRYCSRTI